MSSALTLIVLGQAYFYGAMPNSSFNGPTSIQIPNINSPLIQPTPAPDRETKRPDYTYTPGVGAHKVHTERATWNEARRACDAEGAHLAIINSVAEAEVIIQLLKELDSSFGYVGVHDLFEEGEFVTVHGQPLARSGFAEWRAGEPNDSSAGDGEDCVALFIEGKLNDITCDYRGYFICELFNAQSHGIQDSQHPGPKSASDLATERSIEDADTYY